MYRWAIMLLALLLAVPAQAKPRAKGKGKGSVRVCSVQKQSGKNKRTCRRVPKFSGRLAAKAEIRTAPLRPPSGDIELFVPNLREGVTLNIYGREFGAESPVTASHAAQPVDEAAMAQLDKMFRCSRSGAERAVDPRLFEMMSRFYDHFGRRRIELVSGFRGLERESSRHHHAASMDIRIPGVPLRELHAFAQTLDTGTNGIGIYPNSGFIHFDFRAPGDRSYRWTDLSGPNGGSKTKAKSKAKAKPAVRTKRTQPSKRPVA